MPARTIEGQNLGIRPLLGWQTGDDQELACQADGLGLQLAFALRGFALLALDAGCRLLGRQAHRYQT